MYRKFKKLIKLIKLQILAVILRPPALFSLYMRMLGTKSHPQQPPFLPYAGVLKTQEEIDRAVNSVDQCGLFRYLPLCKNWDALAAMSIVLRHTDENARILDAGGELYSSILPWLHSYHYQNLISVNLCFKKPRYRGRILYQPGDITKLPYPSDYFDAITCLSVIEHHVPLDAYFTEMARVLKPGGVLITSADYWEKGVDTEGKQAYGGAIKIFDGNDIVKAFEIAKNHNLDLVQEVDIRCQDALVLWMNLKFTFIYFSLKKRAPSNTSSAIII
jgi:hypothetical protein